MPGRGPGGRAAGAEPDPVPALRLPAAGLRHPRRLPRRHPRLARLHTRAAARLPAHLPAGPGPRMERCRRLLTNILHIY